MDIKLVNKYVPRHVKHFELPWYERDGLMSLIDSYKSQEFEADSDGHFKKAKFINFAMIHHECRGDPLDPNDVDKTVRSNSLKGYVSKDKIVASAIKCNRKDVAVEKNLIKQHFTNTL